MSILKIEKLKALALGGVILVVVFITLHTKKSMQKMQGLEVNLQKEGVRLNLWTISIF